MSSRPSSNSKRPVSAQSRTAWDDGIDNPAGPQGGATGYDDDMPAAMENEMYDPNVQVVDDRHQVVKVQEPPSGRWYKFTRGVRCE